MDAEIPFRVGDVLVRKYRLERLIGAGGMGVVFAAVHLELQRPVAVKLLRPDQCEHEASVARFLLEARAIARLNGPHVARVLDVGRLESRAPFMVMELLEGRNLHDLIQQEGTPPVPLAVDWLLEACEAVAEAHRAGVLHRDLKPANLFLTRDAYGEPCIKVLDFGISKILEPRDDSEVGLTDSHCMVGSPVYMSPEQMRSARDVDQRTDIWGLGTVLFELLTGRPVWSGETFSDLCAQVTRDPCPRVSELRPEVPEDLAAVVDRCLKKDPFARYQGVSDLSLALARFATQTGRLASKRVLQLAAHPIDSAAAQPRRLDSKRDVDPQVTANALPATVLTRFAAKARPHFFPLSLVSAVLLLGGTLLASMRGHEPAARVTSTALESARTAGESAPLRKPEPPAPGALVTTTALEFARTAGGSASLRKPEPPAPGALVTATALESARTAGERAPLRKPELPAPGALVTTATETIGQGRSRAKAAAGDQRNVSSAVTPAPAPSTDPMSIREAAPTPFSDPMSIRK